MPYYMGAFLAVALKWRTQARNAIKGREALRKLRQKVGALKEEKQNWGLKEETSQSLLKLAHEGREGAEAYRAHSNRRMPINWPSSPPTKSKASASKRRFLPPKCSRENLKNWMLLGSRS